MSYHSFHSQHRNMKALFVLSALVAVAVAKPAGIIAPLAYAGNWINPLGYGINPLGYGINPLGLGLTAPLAAPIAVPAAIASQYHAQDELGQASYGYAHPGQAHDSVRDALGNVAGSYSYVDPTGKIVKTDYVADGLGFRVASNNLPIAPEVPVVPLPLGPAPVLDTPEVAAAKAAHFAEVEIAKSRAKRQILTHPLGLGLAHPLAYPRLGLGLPLATPLIGGLHHGALLL